ncbi:hypothetical protein KY363_00130 [Candidatus Woesearchaeota archaeon]|nr:hypothetical protein [Candidatus Woesearchaeota archaeon]
MPDQNHKAETVAPEEVPPDHLTPLSRKFLDWKTGMVVIVGVLLTFTFLNVLATNPTISGLAVVDAQSQDTTRFSNMTSLLIIVFAFFGLFLFLITRRMDIRKKV